MAATPSDDTLLAAACARLRQITRSGSDRGTCLDAYVITCSGRQYAVRVSQVAQRPTPVFHLTVYTSAGVFVVSCMVTEEAAEAVCAAGKRAS